MYSGRHTSNKLAPGCALALAILPASAALLQALGEGWWKERQRANDEDKR